MEEDFEDDEEDIELFLGVVMIRVLVLFQSFSGKIFLFFKV